MKILRVRFKNLNSLVGEWEIDFTDPAFVNEGIFAITGPTGSGKTTILDAICLGLYGATPRLGAITKGNNQIMSRQTGECLSEVTFAINSAEYRCTWSQHRARFRPNGELQSQKHELVDVANGKIIAETVKVVPGKVEEISGLDFNRFTRSMLLAQGNFAAFLQANANERAPILEQITGTEIYSRISEQVFGRAKAENNLLDDLCKEAAHLTLLSADELEQLQQKKALTSQEIQDLAVSMAVIEKSLQWLAKLDKLRADQANLQQAQSLLQTEEDAFGADRERLRQGTLARELALEYNTLRDCRKQLQQTRENIARQQQLLPGCEADAKNTAINAEASQQALQTHKTTLHDRLPLIQEIKLLDQAIKQQELTCQQSSNALNKQETGQKRQQDKQAQDEQKLASLQVTLNALEQQLQETASDAKLSAELSGLKNQIKAINELTRQIADQRRQVQEQEKLLQSQTQKLQDNELLHSESLAKLQQLQEASQQQLAEREANLQGDDLSTWMGRRDDWQRQLQTLAKVGDNLRERSKAEAEIADLRAEDTRLASELVRLTSAQQQYTTELGHHEEQIELLEQMQLQQNSILDLKAEREKLLSGQPCPLCGAIEHPYASHLPPMKNDLAEKLQATKQAQKLSLTNLAKLSGSLQLHQEKQLQAQQDIAKLEQQVAELTLALRNSWQNLGLDWHESASAEQLQICLDDLSREKKELLNQASKIVDTELKANSASQKLQKQLDAAQEAARQKEKLSQELTAEIKSIEATSRNLQARLSSDEQKHQQDSNLLVAVFQSYGISAVNAADFTPACNTLQVRAQRHANMIDQHQQQSRQQGEITLQIKLQAEQIALQEQQISNSRLALQGQQSELQSLRQSRLDQFQELDPQKEEHRLQAAVTAAEAQAESTRLLAQTAKSELEKLTASLQTLAPALEQWQAETTAAEEKFLHCRQQKGFAEEQDYLAAVLPESDFRQLTAQAENLKNRQISLQARINDNQQQLVQEEAQKVTEETVESLQTRQMELTQNQASKQQELGVMQQILAENQRVQELLADKQEEIDRQKLECNRWKNLNELIGSQDGKKYRNIVQGMTFDIVIGLANRQLEKLTNRYQLQRSEEQLLELNVVDHYQAGETRSCKNLSGGESFIVSLALALGLAQMASHKIRVDSLFLDEGFGTLDDDALELALNTLASLQQDGKLIGIISHVQAIRDRISTKLLVVPTSGGRSQLEKPWLK